jgi:hypothetical protein
MLIAATSRLRRGVQRHFAACASCGSGGRVIYATNGNGRPWPQQRFLQHKWRLAIGYSETLGLHLAHLINDSLSSVRHRLVPFFQEFGENGKVLYWILRGL